MTKLVAGPGGLDMTTDIDFSDYPDATTTTATTAKVVFPLPGGLEVTVKGSGFTYGGPNEFPETGTINSIRVMAGPVRALSATDMTLDVAQMRTFLSQGPAGEAALLNAIFGGDDRIIGSRDGDNNLFALGGDDALVGGSEADTLTGGNGVDTLIGGRGQDVLNGGGDGDTYVFSNTLDSRNKSSADAIIGLDDATDNIDLRAIDANINKTGNQAFEIVAAFTGDEGEMTLTYNPISYATLVAMDVDGDAKADMVLILDGGPSFEDHSDFVRFIY